MVCSRQHLSLEAKMLTDLYIVRLRDKVRAVASVKLRSNIAGLNRMKV